jgi:predicted nucleic acid-binding Zn ribbon protein
MHGVIAKVIEMSKPAAVLLHIDEKQYPTFIARQYLRKFVTKKQLWERNDKARENFGKPGRDYSSLSSVVMKISNNETWKSHLTVADIAQNWAKYVGSSIAEHTQVAEFDNGVLVLRADSTAWSTQLQYLLPSLKKKIQAQLGNFALRDVVIKGPNSYSFKRGMYSVPGRGARDTWG